MLHQPHSTYYRDRHTEEELCQDFPADKIFILRGDKTYTLQGQEVK